MGRILVELCNFNGALVEYRSAAELTPGCLLRAQHVGALAFYQGESEEALKWLERTLSMGVQSKLFDALSLMLIAILRFDRGEPGSVGAMREQLRVYCERFPDSKRLRRFEQATAGLGALLAGKDDLAVEMLRELGSQAGDDDFDLEAANVVLAVWARAPEALRPAGEHEALVERIAMRFCVSKAIGEVLAASARRTEKVLEVIRRCQAQLLALTEKAMERSLKGEPAAAVEALLAGGEETLNAKLLEMAVLIARRHAPALPDAEALAERAGALLRRACRSGSHIAGLQRSGRSPGGLQVRGRSKAEVAHAAA